MLYRVTFLLITLFWVTMNVLLWRSEYGRHSIYGSAVSPKVVWRKVLNAPDESLLDILQNGKRIGNCRWSTAISEAFATMDEAPTPGAAEKLRRYRLQLEGSATLPDVPGRLHFECDLTLSNQVAWEEFELHIHKRPMGMDIHSKAGEQTVRITASDGEDTFDRVFSFSELQNPQALVASLAGPMASGMLDGFYLPAASPGRTNTVPAVECEAHRDVLNIGHQSVHVYRVNARLANQFDVVIYVSDAGELFRVELPDGIVLLHDKFSSF
jgi:hypothetical protein